MNFYSDNGVDRFLIETVFPEYAISKPGIACEVGANNGVNRSNTLTLEENGWIVLCIEANPLHDEHGRLHRKMWRSVACGAKDEEDAEFWYYTSANGDCASSSALVKSGKVPTRTDAPPEEQRLRVPVRTLDRLLDEAGFSRVDVITMDVEGGEPEVLAGLSLEKWKPTVLVVETYGYDMATPENYTMRMLMGFDRVFLRDHDKLDPRRT